MNKHPSEPVVECVSLTKKFKDFWGREKVLAVDKLDLSIQPGEVFGLLGPNGSGKSTTIKILLGLLYPTSGRVRVFGKPPTDTKIKSRIGFMPEESYLYRFLNARETLDYYGRLFRLDGKERRRRTDQLIDIVGLKKAWRRPVGQYSKGMARRIGLAQALINDPDLLILDEPTTGLDPIGSRQIKDVIVELAKRGKTVLLSSHLLADVEDVCDRVVIMYGGRVQAAGRIGELLARQEVTQIRADRLDSVTINRVKSLIEHDAGKRVLAVEHPTDRLEEYFIRIVEHAQRERLETSGAESGRGVAEFLAAPPGTPERSKQVLDQLTRPETPEAPAEPVVVERVEAAHPDRRIVTTLVEKADGEETTEPEPVGPREIKTAAKTDRSVLERLTKRDQE